MDSMQAAGIIFVWILISSLIFCSHTVGSRIGLNYGRVADNLPPPDEVAKLVQSLKVDHVRIFDANAAVLTAFANTGIRLTICVPNDQIALIGSDHAAGEAWIQANVLQYLPSTSITTIAVGNEVLTSGSDNAVIASLVPAMQNIHTALVTAGLDRFIKVSTSHSLDVLGSRFPPSAASFSSQWSQSIMQPMLDFLSTTGSFYMLNMYPYLVYQEERSKGVPLDYALIRPSGFFKLDTLNGIRYVSMFDEIVDAVVSAMADLGHGELPIVVSETGWPTVGDESEVGASIENAVTYNTNLVSRINQNPPVGTQLKPGMPLQAFIFALFNEDQKPGPASERNWGLFYPNMAPVYGIDLTA
ncbi:hypothetical protein O6H91_07G001200 [Diphasiastrum complanatum]|uniref:Uncharacterized protein n=2 Tax=Diphasiastrum complanatum TaxID=34168 RepID=A0ACC2D2G5_DIPCM|nr:hypothetical protein O6H91_07G001200 [Diphasiastrum complanatum]